MPPPANVTELLIKTAEGNLQARDQLWELVYDDLKRIAHRELRRNRAGETIQTTALVHEAFLKIFDQSKIEWNDRVHFFALAARAMRLILVDYARRKFSEKRGGGQRAIQLDKAAVVAEESAAAMVSLDKQLTRLSSLNERLGQVVEFRFFGGMSESEIAHTLGVTDRTVRRDWRKARAWLAAALSD